MRFVPQQHPTFLLNFILLIVTIYQLNFKCELRTRLMRFVPQQHPTFLLNFILLFIFNIILIIGMIFKLFTSIY